MDIKTLKSFISVAENKSFSAAAKTLHTVQPAISRHIAQLEASLGVPLFTRNSREVVITSAGTQLLKHAHRILDEMETARSQVRRAHAGEIGTLRIAHMPSACLPFMARLVNRYIKRYPQVQVSLLEMAVTDQIEAFKENRIDIGFSRPMPRTLQEDYISHDIYMDKLVVIVNQQHPLAAHKSIKLETLQNEAFILFNRNKAVELFDSTIRLCKNAGFSPDIISQPPHMQTLLTEVAAGLGVGIGPYCIRKQYAEGCRFLDIENGSPVIPTQLHIQKDNTATTVNPFVDVALEMKSEIEQIMQAP